MPTGGDRRLRLIKGAPSGTGATVPARAATRRTITRRTPAPTDPVAAILEHLDEEPVESDEPPADDPPTVTPPAAPPPREGSRDHVRFGRSWLARRYAITSAGRAGRRARPVRVAPGRWRVVVGALVVALCAALVATGIFGYGWYGDRTTDRAHQQALAAAKQTTVNFVSISASSVDRDLQRIVAGATGDFKDQFTRGQAQVRAAVVENSVESHGSVLRAGLVSGDRRNAVVLVAVDATVKNTHAPDGRASHYRIQVDMTNQSGRWLVSRLQFVG